jgi:hypothetical protein
VRRGRHRVLAGGLAGLLVAVGTAQATHTSPDTLGHDTTEQLVTGGDPATGYQQLSVETPGENYIVRDGTFEAAQDPPTEGAEAIPSAQTGRETRRVSLAYFSQMTDFQLADEESPARVEFVDEGASSAWRPMEAFGPFMIDASVRQLNAFADASPVPQGDGTFNSMDFSLMTGDQADNQQRNETIWVRELLEGGEALRFDTGIDPTGYDPTLPGCAQAQFPTELPRLKAEAEAHNYTGVQDYDDYEEGPNPYYYDPDDVRGFWADAGWPTYAGLMDRAQQFSFTPAGLDVPFYITNGNHDVLMQGNEDANREFERIAIGCEKVLASTQEPSPGVLDPGLLLFPSATMLIPPDPLRQIVSKPQIKRIYADDQDPAADPDQGHGFGFVDPEEIAASNDSASYYAWDPPEAPGFRFISIDTTSEGGVVEQSSSGNIDDPQFQWLTAELEAASEANKLIVIFGHHPVRSMSTNVPDEAALRCTTNDSHGHDVNPGCDLDPRNSSPVHLGQDQRPGDPRVSFVELLEDFPHVLAYVPGHTHEHRLTPFPREDGTAWWELNTSAVIDWPTQSRLIEVFDNQDGTLSIFTTVLDFAADSTAPAAGSASGFEENELASIGRTFAYNDPQNNFSGEGRGPEDRNAELLLDDPRDGVPNPPGGEGDSPSGQGSGPTDLVLKLDAKQKQRAKIKVTATCLEEACQVELGGKAKAPGDRAKLKEEQLTLEAGESEAVRLKPKQGELGELKDALDDGNGKAKVKGRAMGASGATATDTVKVKLKG